MSGQQAERRAALLSRGDLLTPLVEAGPGSPGTPRIYHNGLGRFFVGRPVLDEAQGSLIAYAPDTDGTLEGAATTIRRGRFGDPKYDQDATFPVTRRLAYAAFPDLRPKNQPLREPPDRSTNEARQETGVTFQEYNGWPNFPSWNVFTVMTSYSPTHQSLQRLAKHGTPETVKTFVTSNVERWQQGKNMLHVHNDATKIVVQDFLLDAVRRVQWTPVYDTLRGEREELGEADTLTTLAYNELAGAAWQTIVADAEYLTQAYEMLRDWLAEQCLTWVAFSDARAHTGSVNRFANTVLETYLQAIQWEQVTDALRGR